MGFVDNINMIVKMYSEGGIEICSGEVDTAGSSPEGQPKYMIKSFIQPDADVLMFLATDTSFPSHIWREHTEKVKKKIGAIKRFRRGLRWVWILAPICFFSGYYSIGLDHMRWFLLASVLSLIPLVLRKVFEGYLKRRIDGAIGHICSQEITGD